MRVLLSPRRRDEAGTVALLTGTLAVVILLLAAFTVDFGLAYASKRQLQTAADSGALAAASVYAKYQGTCIELVSRADIRAEAQAAADAYREENRPESVGTAIELDCSRRGLQVTYETSASTAVSFGQLAGVDNIETSRIAAATVSVAPKLNIGLRPYAICSEAIPKPLTSQVVRIDQPGSAANAAVCDDAARPGNWWTIRCPEDDDSSQNDMGHATFHGCEDEVEIVPGQTASMTPIQRSAHLTDYCAAEGVGAHCLQANTGQISSNDIWGGWAKLLATQETFVIPVFCGLSYCDPSALPRDGGGNVVYPVHSLATVTVCGYHWGGNGQKQGQITTGACANNPNNYKAVNPGGADNHANFLLLVFRNLQVSGGTKQHDCELGSSCDNGLRRVLLTQ